MTTTRHHHIEVDVRTVYSCAVVSITSAITKDLPKGARIVSIDGRAFVSWCESCGKPLFEGQRHISVEDANLCMSCYRRLSKNGEVKP